MTRKIGLLCATFFVLPSIFMFSQSTPDPNKKVEYLTLPPGLQANCALYKLGLTIQKLKNSGDNAKLAHLEQGRILMLFTGIGEQAH